LESVGDSSILGGEMYSKKDLDSFLVFCKVLDIHLSGFNDTREDYLYFYSGKRRSFFWCKGSTFKDRITTKVDWYQLVRSKEWSRLTHRGTPSWVDDYEVLVDICRDISGKEKFFIPSTLGES
jgi:hypothetical protein